jgi:hypothetical protein
VIRVSRGVGASGWCQSDRVTASRYRLVVEGELGKRSCSAFEGMEIEYRDGNTVFVGDVVDQAHLQGLLERVSRLGLKLISVTPAGEGG